jgi:thiosulfate reductase cytochrome b subunit
MSSREGPGPPPHEPIGAGAADAGDAGDAVHRVHPVDDMAAIDAAAEATADSSPAAGRSATMPPAEKPSLAEPPPAVQPSAAEPAAARPSERELPPPVAARPAAVRRHHWLVRVTHWANAVLLVGMIASGLQIYNAYHWLGPRGGPFYPNPWNGKSFPPWATLGGWLAGGLNWHFFLAWPFVIGGLAYVLYLALSGEWRSLLFQPRDVPRAIQMQLYYLRLRREHPPQGKHNALQKAAYTFIVLLAIVSTLSGFAIYKTDQLPWLTRLFGGYELARFWHFWAVFVFIAFTLAHVTLVFLVDPASLRAMITGWYRGRFPSHD